MIEVTQIKEATKAAGITLGVSVEDCLDIDFNDLGLDSLDLFNLFLELENITDVSIADSDVDTMKTFSDIIKYYK
ncbi:acyl carrier protein [Aliivibrio fischeri]|uniref:acyl carrier protein n=1 Tax=Aliivibrio fischeri TaxID=668 RepID=UPI0012D86482|nr:phosphopantetheine-binding protein [Aliivibrio fischeri]MUI52495.1 acyl carrier protein [Aliivibrio fischeri]